MRQQVTESEEPEAEERTLREIKKLQEDEASKQCQTEQRCQVGQQQGTVLTQVRTVLSDTMVGLEARLPWNEKQVNENSTEVLPKKAWK